MKWKKFLILTVLDAESDLTVKIIFYSLSPAYKYTLRYIYIYKSGNLIKKEERRAEKTKRLTQAQRDRLFDLIESWKVAHEHDDSTLEFRIGRRWFHDFTTFYIPLCAHSIIRCRWSPRVQSFPFKTMDDVTTTQNPKSTALDNLSIRISKFVHAQSVRKKVRVALFHYIS